MANSTADGSVVIDVDMNVSQAEKRLGKLRGDIKKTESKIAGKEGERSALVEQLKAANDAAVEAQNNVDRLKKAIAESERTTSSDTNVRVSPETYIQELENQTRLKAELSEQVKILREKEQLAEKISVKDEKILATINEQTGTLEEQKAEAGILTQQIEKSKSSQNGFTESVGNAGKAVVRLNKRVAGLASSVFVFSVITMALRGIRNLMSKYVKTNDKARAAIAQLKGALLTLAQPLLEVLIPAFTTFVSLLARVVNAVAGIVSSLFGKTLKQSQDGAKALNDQAEAYGAVGDAAKDAGKSMASFDELNTIGDEKTGAGGGGGADTIAPDFTNAISDSSISLLTDLGLLVIGALLTFTGASILLGIGMMALGAYGIYSEITENPEAVKTALNGWLGEVLVVAGMVSIVIGAVLAFSGVNIPLGIFLMALGALTEFGVASIAPDTMKTMLGGWLGEVLVVAGLVAIAIGAVLAFSSVNIPLGIFLMAIGALAEFGVAALAPDTMKTLLGGWLGEVLVVAGIVAIAIGAVLAFSGWNIPLGIFLMAMGALTEFGVASIAPDTMKEMLNGWLGTAITVVGMIALVLGVVLAFSAINIPLGIALIVLGAGAIIAESVLAPDKMKEMLKGWLGTALVIVGIVAVVLGILLIVSGVGLPLGIALLVLGVGGLFTGIAAKWDLILEKLKGIWSSISNWWNTTVVPKLKAIGGFFSDFVINPLISGVESFINFFIRGINLLISKLNSFGFDLPDVLGGGHIGFNIPKLTEVQLPRLAQGAVIPPNREFMAVLGDQKHGTNIETPLPLMIQAFKQALSENGRSGSHTVILQVDRRELGRVVYEVNNEETQRIGVNFAGVRT